MIDTHTHLDHGPAPEDELVAAAREAGVNRILTIGMDSEALRSRARRRRNASTRSSPPSAATPTAPRASTTPTPDELAELAQHPRCRAIGETGLDYYRDHAPRDDQERAFLAQIEIARAAGKPLVIHTRAADDDTDRARSPRARRASTVVLHCFSMPDRLDECLERGWWISFAGNVTYPANAELAAAAERVPLDRLLVETDAPLPDPAGASASSATRPPSSSTPRASSRSGAASTYAELEQAVEANAARLFGW